MTRSVTVVVALVIAGCGSSRKVSPEQLPTQVTTQEAAPEATSFFGKPLFAPKLSPGTQRDLEQQRLQAHAQHRLAPADPDRIIWLGRRTAYLGRYREAIEIYTRGIRLHPAEPRLYRHRGHRYITVRKLDNAIADLERAANLILGMPDEVEEDGLPNALNIPTSTLNSNVWYHLGLAYYLKGDFPNAARSYRECLKFSTNDDMLCATADWLYMTLRRLNQPREADGLLRRIHTGMNIIENTAYHRRLLMYKGELHPDSLMKPGADEVTMATYGYGIGNWHLYNGRRDEAMRMFQKVLQGTNWAAFGFIAAEADLKNMMEGR